MSSIGLLFFTKVLMNYIGLRFKEIRKLLAKSQEALANDLSVTKQAISNIENSKSSPSISILCKLQVDFNVNLNYLIAGFGNVFVDDVDNNSSLKKTILEEVENMLNSRGVK